MRKTGLNLLAVLLAVPALSACAEDSSSLYVEGVLAPNSPACEYSPDPGQLQLFRGTLDVAFTTKYEGVVLVGNQLATRGNKAELRTETSGLRIRGSEVQLRNSQGSVLDEFSVNGGGFIQPVGGNGAGYGLAQVTMIPPAVGRDLADQLESSRGAIRTLIASVRVFGETLGGLELTSSDFTFPIDVCYGCLVDYPLEAVQDPGDGSGLVCVAASDGITLEACAIGQDERIDCRACAAAVPVCYRVE
jgi:hypothetical protein